ncbi:MAG: PEP-CTERM sorting domain-containing protein [Phycisphaerae bacterium]|nr:PEP-CTERM sorting domain-containing protein [Phycisphaerae bacterium]MDD5381808.1 PEP-CTERM sorting domain-containing protein [Phycisphaerae bacterium]
MCNKLIVLSVALVVVGLSVSASAAYIGFDQYGNSGVNPLKVDIVYNQQPKVGWQPWSPGYAWTGPVGQDFANPFFEAPWEIPHIELDAFKTGQTPNNNGGSSSRSGGFAYVAGTGEYNATGKMFGMNYLKLTITGLAPETEYRIRLWSFDMRQAWAASSNNPDSKFGCWSTINPVAWLTYNGYPNGYSPIQPVPEPITGESGMPQELADLVATDGGRTFMMAPANDNNNYIGGTDYCVSFKITTSSEGAISIYGWIDPTDWTGAMLMPLNGFMVIPEPATIALLGLGGLALLRKRRK